MVSQADAVFQEALQLSEDARMDLVERLIISMPGYRDLEEEQIQEAERRIAARKAGEYSGDSGEAVFARIQASLEARRQE